MKKIFLISLLILIVFPSCKNSPTPDPYKEAQVNLTLDQVLLRDFSKLGYDNSLEFDLYIERPDVSLKEPINNTDLYTIDLPLKLQPRLMYVSEISDKIPDSGNMCDRSVFPHRCSVTVDEKKLKSEYTFLVKITFEDNSYAEKEITIPVPKALEIPEIIEPTSIPKQNSTVEMKFKDIGASYYKVDVNLCHPYQNDGIDPCLDSVTYLLNREKDKLILQSGDEYTSPEINLKDGIVEIKSNFPIIFEESVEYYVQAILISEFADGIKTYTEANDSKVFAL